MLEFSIYLLYRAGTAVIRALPLRLLFRIGEVIGALDWFLFPNYRRLAERNVAIAFDGEMSAREQRRLVRRHFRRLGANLLCGVRMTAMSREELLACVEFDGASLQQQIAAARPVVLLLSHVGNWEAFAHVGPFFFPNQIAGTVFQPLRNRYIDAHLRHLRTRLGVEVFARTEGFAGPTRLLRRKGMLGILSDQHAGDHGVWTPFFGRLASTTPLPALLARRSGAALFPGSFECIGVARWRMSFGPPIDAPDESIDAVTERGNRAIEERVRRSPEDWFWVHNRWKTPKPNFLLTQYKRAVYLPPDVDAKQLKPFRILVRAPNWLGDSVICASAIRALKRGRPDAHITILAPEKIAPVWRLVDGVDEVVPLKNKSVFAAARELRRLRKFDVAVVLPKSFRAALEVWLARVPRRVGFRGHHRAFLLNQVVPDRPRDKPIDHQVNDWLHLVRSLGHDAEFSLPAARPTASNNVVRLGLCPGAEYGPAKRWLPQRFAAVAAAVAQRKAVEWVLFGTSADAAVGAEISAALDGKCINLIGQTSLDELIDELARCRLLLTNDTGTMHLATLIDVPVVAVFGSTEPRLTGPLSANATVVRRHVECSPCFLRECPIDLRCMHAISVDEVVDATMAWLS